MDPARKRQIRLAVALGAAVVLAAALVYVSFSASTEAREPSDLIGVSDGNSYELTGKVVHGTVETNGTERTFEVSDRDGTASIPVVYTGQIPDPFREGREVIVTGKVEKGTFVAEKDSLITKCPSKYSEEAAKDPEHVLIED